MTVSIEDRANIVQAMANAIGYEMFKDDGRPVEDIDGVPSFDCTDEEVERCLRAADRAYRQGIEGLE